MKGIVICYINRGDYTKQTELDVLRNCKEYNAEIVSLLSNEGYEIVFISTMNESSRFEKIDFDKAFPYKESK